jgi:hypothetical protein
VRVPDDHVVLPARVDHARHLLEQFRMLVLARDAELLAEIALADQDRADAPHLGQHLVEIVDPAHVLDLQDHEDLAVRIERPDVGLAVILLLPESPVARRAGRAVAADAGRLEILRALQPRIAAGRDRIVGLLHRGDVRPDDAVAADVERLLGVPLALLDAVHRHAHHRGHGGAKRAGLHDLRPIEHVLQRVAQRPPVPRIVLHLEHHAVVFRDADRIGGIDLRRGEACERRLPRHECADDSVETRQIGHSFPLVGIGAPRISEAHDGLQLSARHI